MKILCVTHSDRSFLEARCDLNYLEKRFPDNRFDSKSNSKKITGIKQAIPYKGMLSLWKIEETDYSLTFLKSYYPDYKVQFATFHNEVLVVYGSDRIEVLNMDFECVRKIEDPAIAGGHTIHFDKEGFAWINSAPGNMILKINIHSGEIVEKIKMSDLYGEGFNYENKDIKDFFIPTDLQPTHVNCAFPHDNSIYVTLLIQGVVGVFDAKRKYREIISGFRGLHSGKINLNSGELYFTDSPAGIIWFYDMKGERFVKRFKINSRWVHDCDHIENETYAAGLSDDNSIQILSTKNMSIQHRYDMSDFGKSVMFVNCCQVNQQWENVLVPDQKYEIEFKKRQLKRKSIVPYITNPVFWKNSEYVELEFYSCNTIENAICLKSERKLTYEYLFVSEAFNLPAGKYRLQADMCCKNGGISIGIVQKNDGSWLVQFNMDSSIKVNDDIFLIEREEDKLICIVAANNPEKENDIELLINKIRIEPLFDLESEQFAKIFEEYDVSKVIQGLKIEIEELKHYANTKEIEISRLIKEYDKIKLSYEKINALAIKKEDTQ